ncbi:sensor domain-containing diguanylate cyclase [Salisediminibacterium selenitireducens]|nr:sensor domain-containing diguanylate cyclase [Salisediminibacterium selenitireducens]
MKRFFYKQSKNLHVLREISLALQSTLQKNKLMHIFLTAVTAGYGLGFNRAMIFLKKDLDQETFVGNAAIGPLSIQEGHQIWENVVSQRLTLRDFIKLQKEAEENDQELNRKVRDLEFNNAENYPVLKHVIDNKDPLLVNVTEWYSRCKMVKKLNDDFDVKNMAVIPLMTRGRAIGVMVIDNIVDGKPFSYEDLDNIMPLATQGAMAIENAVLYERTQELVMTDGLTRLRNKRYLETITQDLYTDAKLQCIPLAVMMIDLDYFKVYNDTNGHLMGDQVLLQVAEILSDLTPDEGVAIRFGGEEFCVILPGYSKSHALTLAENIRKTINEYPFKSRERQPDGALSASIGLSSYPDCIQEPESLIETADQAVYASKKNGRNRVTVFSSSPKGVQS